MKRILTGTCVAMACAVSLAAQTPATTPAQDQQPKASQPAAAADKSVTMKGCLRAGDQPDTFVLANASSGTATGTAGTSGTAAGGAAATKTQTVRLIGAPAGVSLKDHVGHTIEVTGMIAPQGAGASTAGSSSTPGAAASASASDAQRLNVKTVKHVDANCGA
jgi:hypothetical protein